MSIKAAEPMDSASSPPDFNDGQFSAEHELMQSVEALLNAPNGPRRIEINGETLEQGLARLVTLVLDFIRRLLELQAIRRMEGGGLSPQQVEDLGLTMMQLEEKLNELKERLGVDTATAPPNAEGSDIWADI